MKHKFIKLVHFEAKCAKNFGNKLQYVVLKCAGEVASCSLDDWRRDSGRSKNITTVTVLVVIFCTGQREEVFDRSYIERKM